MSQIDGYIEKNIPSRWKNVGGDMITGWLLWNEHWYYLKPDGIMAADMPASAFLKAAVKIGKKVPEEFAVIAYDGTYVSRTNIMEITTIHQQLHEIGNRAVDTILRLIDGEMPQERYITIPVELKKGSTT